MRGSTAGSFRVCPKSIPIRRTCSTCCARVATGHAAAPPRMVRNSRRLQRKRLVTTPCLGAQRHGASTYRRFHPPGSAGGPVRNSFDHLVGVAKQLQGYGDPKSLGGFEVHDQLDFRDLLDRQVTLPKRYAQDCTRLAEAASSSATDVSLFTTRAARRRSKSGFAGGYLLELLPICIRRFRSCSRLSATVGRTVRKRCKAALRHRVRYVIAIGRFLADAARDQRLKACHTLVVSE